MYVCPETKTVLCGTRKEQLHRFLAGFDLAVIIINGFVQTGMEMCINIFVYNFVLLLL